ncbi:hypothetical protein ACFW1A_01240 [Kitasatospora sp. NPDC058965]|uniref:hypothetical protein n=1 Tax=Kitasatospora sp. NPDC058965 TaxID=3346682 RepID=UPI0036C7D137
MAEHSATRTGRLMAELRAGAVFRAVAPMEAVPGWPLPARRRRAGAEPVVALRFPLHTHRAVREGGALLFPPFATLTADWATGRVVEYTDLRYSRPWPVPGGASEPVGFFPHEAVRTTLGAYTADRERLLAGYDDLADALAAERAFGGAPDFAELLRRLLEPGLEPYYRALAPRFLDRFLGPGPSAAG